MASYAAQVLADGAAGYWKMDDASGSLTDVKGTNNIGPSGTIGAYGVPGLVQGSPGYAISLNGSGYFAAMPTGALNLGDVFTLEAWIKRNSTAAAYSAIISRLIGCYCYRLNTTGKIELLNSQTAVIATSTSSITDTTTAHHVVATKNGAAVHIYIDGVDVTGAVTNSTCAVNNAYPFQIGADQSGQQPANLVLDELAVYPTALTAAQVQNHYTLGTSPPPPPTPVSVPGVPPPLSTTTITGQQTTGSGTAITGWTTASQFGTVGIKAVTRTGPGGVPSAQAFGVVTARVLVPVPGVPSAQQFGQVRIKVYAQVIGVPSAQQFGQPTAFNVSIKPTPPIQVILVPTAPRSDTILTPSAARSDLILKPTVPM